MNALIFYHAFSDKAVMSLSMLLLLCIYAKHSFPGCRILVWLVFSHRGGCDRGAAKFFHKVALLLEKPCCGCLPPMFRGRLAQDVVKLTIIHYGVCMLEDVRSLIVNAHFVVNFTDFRLLSVFALPARLVPIGVPHPHN